MACRAGDPLPELAGYDCVEGRRLSRAEVEAELGLLYEAFPAAVGRLRAELGPDASVAEAIDAFIAAAGLAPAAARRARQGLRAVIEAEAADLAERQSLRWMWNEIEYDGDYFGDLPVGGYRRWSTRWPRASTCGWAWTWPRSRTPRAACGCGAPTARPRKARTSW